MLRIIDFLVCLFFILIFIIPQSFFLLKIPVLFVVISYVAVKLIQGELIVYSFEVVKFYFFISCLSIFWVFIGSLYGNNVEALTGSFKLYVVYSLIYLLLVIYISNRNFYNIILPLISVSAIIISAIIFCALFEVLSGIEFIPLFIKEKMDLRVGIHSGYTHITSRNVATFSFILPFLISFVIMEKRRVSKLVYGALFLSLLALLVTSRRMILFVVVFVPFLCIILDVLVTFKIDLKLFYKVFWIYILVLIILFTLLLFVINSSDLFSISGLYTRIFDALIYDTDSPRQKQFSSLLNGFYSFPLFGTGFGGEASEIRSLEMPWAYELTYSKLLFNAGIIGTTLVVCLFGWYIIKAIRACRNDINNYPVNFSLMIGFFSVIIIYSSNPYINFDLLFVWGILPLIIVLSKKDRLLTNRLLLKVQNTH